MFMAAGTLRCGRRIEEEGEKKNNVGFILPGVSEAFGGISWLWLM